MTKSRSRTSVAILLLLSLFALLTGCGDDDGASSESTSEPGVDSAAAPADEAGTVRLGYFPNLTHATAIVGVEKGIFARNLGDTKLETKLYNAGPEATEALFAEALDASYIGPNPAINAFAKSKGEAIRIISGATSGGAFLVVKPEIASAADLKGKTLATPQLGNTQDVALRAWLKENGLDADASGGGDVSIKPQQNGEALTAFREGQIDGGWVPEPWATRMIQEGKGKVLVDERTLWPGGQFVTTHLIVRTKFLEDNPQTVKRLLQGQVEANEFVNTNGAEARTVAAEGIAKLTGKPLPAAVVDAAWANLTFTDDPIASSLAKGAKDAEEAGLLEPVELDGIYDLEPLNELLTEKRQKAVEGL